MPRKEPSLLGQWILLLLVPSIYFILRDEFSRVLNNIGSPFWSFIFYLVVTIAVIVDILILIKKTWEFLEPIMETIGKFIENIIKYFRK